MNFLPKRWIGLGLGAALLGVAGLAACGGEQAAPPVAADHGAHVLASGGEDGEGATASIETPMQRLSADKRLALLSGHVVTGLTLYRAGDPGEAAHHLKHPVAEEHADEQAGLDEFGFKPDVFRQVLAELEAGRPASEIEPLLAEAETNLTEMRAAAGGDPKSQIEFLMKSLADRYDAGVDTSTIVSLGDYQDAYGFAVVARDVAAAQDPAFYGPLKLELDLLVLMWPRKGPVSTSLPPPEFQMAEQLARVKLALATLP